MTATQDQIAPSAPHHTHPTRSLSIADSLVTVSLSSDPGSDRDGGSARLTLASDQTTSVLSGPLARQPSSETISDAALDALPSDGQVPDHPGRRSVSEIAGSSPSQDQITALVARLEEENARLASDPKANHKRTPPLPAEAAETSGPPSHSLRQIGRLVHPHLPAGTRISLLPERPLTELEFWSYLVRDFHSVSTSLRSLTLSKLRAGVPPPLRGLVWASVAGVGVGTPTAVDLAERWKQLAGADTPQASAIAKDVGRCFPTVPLFASPSGPGQRMLARVLSAYSLYDPEIGYCQGLGFVAGTVLMQMGECEAFAVLVRLMDHYNLRSFYLPNLSGLHVAIFQFQSLLRTHRLQLATHFEAYQIDGSFLTQWFLSLYASTCPLPILFRIYDLILLEGAASVLVRVALALLFRNEARLLASSDFGDIIQFLLSRKIWDVFHRSDSHPGGPNSSSLPATQSHPSTADPQGSAALSSPAADALIRDVLALSPVVTAATLADLEVAYQDLPPPQHHHCSPTSLLPVSGRPFTSSDSSGISSPFLGGSLSPTASSHHSSTAPSVTIPDLASSPPGPQVLLTSLALSSSLSASSKPSPIPPPIVILPAQETRSAPVCADNAGTTASTGTAVPSSRQSIRPDRSLHDQIESLLTALRHLQLEHSSVIEELRAEKESRAHDLLGLQTLLQSVEAHLAPDHRLDLDWAINESHSHAHSPTALTFARRSAAFVHCPVTPHSRSKSAGGLRIPPPLHTAMTIARHRLNKADRINSGIGVPYEPPTVQVLRTAFTAASARAKAATDALAVRDAQIIRLTDQLASQTLETEQLRIQTRNGGRGSQNWASLVEELREVRAERDKLLSIVAVHLSSSAPAKNPSKPPPLPGLKQFRLGDVQAHSRYSHHALSISRSPSTHVLHSPNATTLPRANLAHRISSDSALSEVSVRKNKNDKYLVPSTTVIQLQSDLDTALMELAKAKTAEASALQDLDEMRARFDSLRKTMRDPSVVRAVASAFSTPSAFPSSLSSSLSSSSSSSSLLSSGSASASSAACTIGGSSPSTGPITDPLATSSPCAGHSFSDSLGLGAPSCPPLSTGLTNRTSGSAHSSASKTAFSLSVRPSPVASTSGFGGLLFGWRKASGATLPSTAPASSAR